MTPAPRGEAVHVGRWSTWRDADWRHGLRLAIGVVVAFAIPTALGLPESFWAVMSTLIVVRPTAGSALGAGWDRVRGTLSGTAIGLAGVWLHHVGAGSTAATLSIIAIVAFLSAVVPAMRSAPISALIILTSGGIAGHSALDVAGLRAIEIAIGVATGIAVSLFAFAAHARVQFVEAIAAWLRTAARQARDDLTDPEIAAAARDARREASRDALREIAILAVGADREARWLSFFGRAKDPAIDRVTCARTLTRIASDVGSVVRAAGCAPSPLDQPTRSALADALDASLAATANAIDGDTATLRPALGNLHRWSSHNDAPVPWIAAPVRLLAQDLRQLAGFFRARAETPSNAEVERD